MIKKISVRDVSLGIIFLVMMLWDVLDGFIQYSQFIVLFIDLLIYVFYYRRIKIHKTHIIMVAIIMIHGIINIYGGKDTAGLLMKQLLSITFCILVFATILDNIGMKKFFQYYYYSVFIMSVLGIIMLVFDIRKVGYSRLHALFQEPSFFGYFALPIVALVLIKKIFPNMIDRQLFTDKRNIFSVVIIVAYMLTFSSVAYLGILIVLAVCWLHQGINIKKISVLILGCVCVCVVYNYIPDIRLRINETLLAFGGEGNIYGLNLSSYTLYNNFNVTLNSFKSSFGLGTGLGSYQNMFDMFSMGNGRELIYNFNREDANSMALRIVSELGVPGMIGVLWFLKKYFIKGRNVFAAYSCSIFSLLILFLVRQGNYTHGCSIAMWYMYYKIWKEYRISIFNSRGIKNG